MENLDMFIVLFLILILLLVGCSRITDLLVRIDPIVEDVSSNFLGAIIPIYSYPTQGNPEYRNLESVYVSKRVYVVLNPNNGPGSSVDTNYESLINRLKLRNYELIGYVYTTYGSRSIVDVTNDINMWYSFYSNIDGIFVDEASDSSNQISFYQVIYDYVKSKDSSDVVVLNPGVVPHIGYFGISDIIIVAEVNQRVFLDSWSSQGSVKEKSAILIYGVQDKDKVLNKAISEGVGYVYITDEETNSWFRVSRYLRDIVK